MECPLDYSLCRDTVTLYGLRGGRVRRQVVEKSMYRYRVSEVLDREGRRHQAKCLLIIPGYVDLRPGDRVYAGVGPELTASEWAAFLPVQVPGLTQISTVTPYFFMGRLRHIEAT